MRTSLTKAELTRYTTAQLNHLFPDNKLVDLNGHVALVTEALDRLEFCFKHCTLKHYFNGEEVIFNHLHSDHYVMYLWYLANSLWRKEANANLCNKLYYLNKTLHGLDCMYNTQMPDIFLLFHCSGTMLGKATYADFFVALQGVTVGSQKGVYPVMDKGVSLTAHSSLIGNCKIGKNVSVSAYTNIFETDIANNTVAYRSKTGEVIFKPSATSYAQTFFNVPIE
ncbi:serine acetyltransferase [Flavisolibacter ginsenosidimutans]|uniref:Serine acetyltransferase n=1 Tax=Flavisolibacter ginsenosidimutans TaxID=661481 RepID=A0A5B8UIS7_9BACT|nr:serine acetyltransferase [Flavisolibacter ginsenosidimutans]QEC56478.1 serine acetyltransferase [Flavisolibacter ginsenosidimutans]